MSTAALAGQKLAGLYWLRSVVAHGAHGVVYEAEHAYHGTRHAIKVFYPEGAESGAFARCRRDAEMAAALHHVGIVRIAEWSRPEILPTAYIVMDYVEGENFQARVRRLGRMTPAQALDLGMRVGQSLMAAHKLGVVHRGLTPRNVMFVPVVGGPGEGLVTEEVQLLDFGVAHMPARADLLRLQAAYLAPEVLRGEDADGRADQYSLAAILYEALTGRRPPLQELPPLSPQQTGEIELLEDEVEGPRPPLEVLCPEAPVHLLQAVERGLSGSASNRYASMVDFIRALEDRGPNPWRRAGSASSSVMSARSARSASLGLGVRSAASPVSPEQASRALSSTSAQRLRALEESRVARASRPPPAQSGQSAQSRASSAPPRSTVTGAGLDARASLGEPREPSVISAPRAALASPTLMELRAATELPGRPEDVVSVPVEVSGRSARSGRSGNDGGVPGSARTLGRDVAPSRQSSVNSLTPISGQNGQKIDGRGRGRTLVGAALGAGLALTAALYGWGASSSSSSGTSSSDSARLAESPGEGQAVRSGAAAPYVDLGAPEADGALAPEVDPEAQLMQAQAALARGEHARAIELSRAALPSVTAWRVIATAACKLGNHALSEEALQQLNVTDQALVQQQCAQ